MKEKFKTKPIAITLIFVLMFQYFSVILSLLESNANSYTDSVTGITWEYELNSDEEAINVKPSGTLTGEIVVPNTIDGHSVTGIAESAFYGKNNITKITLPGTVETIGESAFKNCSSLSEINLPAGITTITNSMFYNCSSLSNIELAEGLNNIGNAAFYGCSSLTELTIPNSVESIGISIFKNCSSLSEINLPAGITTITNSMFYNCSSLSNIELPEGLNKIEDSAFYGCSSLTEITIPSSVETLGKSAFEKCTGLTEVIISNGVTAIGESAFSECTSITNITIPKSITNIGGKAFTNCSNLEEINVEEDNTDYTSSEGVLYNKDKTTIIFYPITKEVTGFVIPDTVTKIGAGAFYGCNNLTNVEEIIANITNIEEYAFFGCTGLTEIVIPNNVEEIGKFAFSECTGITNVTFSRSLSSLGACVFSKCTGLIEVKVYNTEFSEFLDCTSLKKVIILDGATIIGENAFYGCIELSDLTIPNSVTSIDSYAFKDCIKINNVIIPESVTDIGFSAFRECTGLTNLTITNGVINIGRYSFYGCTSLNNVIIPESVTSIGWYAFYGCTGLTNLTIKNGVTSIDNYAFNGCTGLTELTIPESVTSFGDYVFGDCSNLTSVKIGGNIKLKNQFRNPFNNCKKLTDVEFLEGVTEIDSLFYNFKSLKNIILPNSLINIGNYAFYACTNVASISIPENVTKIGNGAFYGCTGLTSIEIPGSVTNIGNNAFAYCRNLKFMELKDGVTKIGDYAFDNVECNIIIPESVTSIGYRALYDAKIFCYKDSKAHEYAVNNNISYTLINDELAVVNGVIWKYEIIDNKIENLYPEDKSYLTNVEIPAIINGYPVNSIKSFAFSSSSNITSVTIPEGITTIHSYAFGSCRGLNSIILPESLTTIESSAFYNCTGLTNVNIPGNVKKLSDFIFRGCTVLTTVTLPENLEEIGESAFYDCTSLTTVELPEGLKRIKISSFNGCTSLNNIIIPGSVTSIGSTAFNGCTSLSNLELKDGLQSIGQEVFKDCTALEAVEIPGSVTSIGKSIFSGCTNLTNIELKNGITSIGEETFKNCTGLQTVTIPESVTNIGQYAFANCTNLRNINMFAHINIINNYTFNNCTSLENIEIPNGVTSIGDGAFKGCNNLKIVNIPESVTKIGQYAFSECTSLENIEIPQSVTIINKFAFYLCSSLKGIELPNGMGTIYQNTFAGCTNLANITIPDSLIGIEGYAFSDCQSLSSVIIPKKTSQIGNYAFYRCTNLSEIIIMNSGASISESAFYGCNNYTIVCPRYYTNVYSYAKNKNVNIRILIQCNDKNLYEKLKEIMQENNIQIYNDNEEKLYFSVADIDFIEGMKEFDISNDSSVSDDKKIEDLTGIEQFVNLEKLSARNNKIKMLVGCKNLLELDISYNQLAGFEAFTRLIKLDVSHNNIEYINLGYDNDTIEELNASYNKINSISIYAYSNTNIRKLNLDNNYLSSVDIRREIEDISVKNEQCKKYINSKVVELPYIFTQATSEQYSNGENITFETENCEIVNGKAIVGNNSNNPEQVAKVTVKGGLMDGTYCILKLNENIKVKAEIDQENLLIYLKVYEQFYEREVDLPIKYSLNDMEYQNYENVISLIKAGTYNNIKASVFGKELLNEEININIPLILKAEKKNGKIYIISNADIKYSFEQNGEFNDYTDAIRNNENREKIYVKVNGSEDIVELTIVENNISSEQISVIDAYYYGNYYGTYSQDGQKYAFSKYIKNYKNSSETVRNIITDEYGIHSIDKNILDATVFENNILVLKDDGKVYITSEKDELTEILGTENIKQIEGKFALNNNNQILECGYSDEENTSICYFVRDDYDIEKSIEKISTATVNGNETLVIQYEDGTVQILQYAVTRIKDGNNNEVIIVDKESKLEASASAVDMATENDKIFILENNIVRFLINKEKTNKFDEKIIDFSSNLQDGEFAVKINKYGMILTNYGRLFKANFQTVSNVNNNITSSDNTYYLKNYELFIENVEKLGDSSYQTEDNKVFCIEQKTSGTEKNSENKYYKYYIFNSKQIDDADDLRIEISKDESELSEGTVKITVNFPDDEYKVKLPNGEEKQQSPITYEVTENGAYGFKFTDSLGKIKTRVVHVTNFQNRKETKIPIVEVLNNKISLKCDGEQIKYSIDDKQTWNNYTEELTYVSPIYAKIENNNFECSIIKIIINENGQYEVTTEENRKIQSDILSGARVSAVYINTAINISQDVANIIANTTLEEEHGVLDYIYKIADNVIYNFSSTDGRYAGCFYEPNNAASEIVYKDLAGNINSLESERTINSNDINIDYAVIGTTGSTEKNVKLTNNGNLESDIRILNKAKQHIGSNNIVKIFGSGSLFYILTNSGDVYEVGNFLYSKNDEDSVESRDEIYKLQIKNIIDIYETGTAKTIDGNIISLYNSNVEDQRLAQKLQSNNKKYLENSHLGLKDDGTLYYYPEILEDDTVVGINLEGIKVKRGKIVPIEDAEKAVGIFSKKQNTIKMLNIVVKRCVEEQKYKIDKITALNEENEECYITVEEDNSKELPKFIDIAEHDNDISLGNEFTNKYVKTIAVDEDGEVYIYLYEGYIVDTGLNLDYFGPTANYELDNSKWTKNNVNLSLSGNTKNEIVSAKIKKKNKTRSLENEVEIANLQNTEEAKIEEQKVEIDKNGIYTYEIEDKKGRSYSGTMQIGNIDKLKPITPEIGTVNGKLQITFKDDQEATEDSAKSGIMKYEYKINDGEWQISAENIKVLDVGKDDMVYAKSTDNAENESDIASGKLEQGTLRVKYLDEDETELDDDDVTIKAVGTPYNIIAKEINNYHILEDKTVGDLQGTYTNGETTIKFYYAKDKYKVTFYDEDGTTKLGESEVEYGANASYEGEIPTKAATQEKTYTFDNWYTSTDETGVVDDLSNVIENRNVYARYIDTTNKYKITFYDEDGVTSLDEVTVEYGANASYTKGTPTKESTAQYTYTFSGWDDPEKLNNVTENRSVKATYTSTVNKYTVTFYDEDGVTSLDEVTVEYGANTSYTKDTPTKESTAQYTYTFSGWDDPEKLNNVTENRSVKATYTSTVNKYTVTFYDEDGTTKLGESEVEYESNASYTGEVPSKEATQEKTYAFDNWYTSTDETGVVDDLSNVIANRNVYARYIDATNKYTITFYDEDGRTLLGTTTVEYGADASYEGKTPEKQATAQYTYTFSGWDDPEKLNNVTENRSVKATYSKKVNKHTVIFYDENGSTKLGESEVEYGANASYEGKTPEKQTTAQYTYTFSGWDDPEKLNNVTENRSVKATYSKKVNKYTVTFYDENGSTKLGESEVEYGANASYTGEIPSKEATQEKTYAFDNWYTNTDETGVVDDLSNVIENRNVYARYIDATNKYTITFYDEDGSTLLGTTTVKYGANASYNGTKPNKEESEQYTYTFDNWYTSTDETGVVDNLRNVIKDRNVYARYVKNAIIGKVIISYQDIEGNDLKESKTLSGEVGKGYKIEKIEIEGYELKEVEGKEEGKFAKEDQTVIYKYSKIKAEKPEPKPQAEIGKVIVKYEDINGKKLAENKTLSGEVGKGYKAEKIEIAGYEFKEVQGKEEGKFTKEEQYVIYKYKKIPEPKVERGKVIAKYQDENGNTIKEDITLEGEVGKDYKTEKAEFEIYEFVKVEGKEEGKFEKEEQVVIYKYNKKSGRIIIIYNDPNGEKIKENDVITGKIGSDYKVQRQLVDGYELIEIVGKEEGKYTIADQFVLYKYKKIENKATIPQTGQTRVIYMALGIIIVMSTAGIIAISIKIRKNN